MRGHRLVEPFDIDGGALDGVSPTLAFTLGVEWAMFRRKLRHREAFRELVISQNADRLVRMAERHGRFVEHHPHCDGWTEIVVGDYLV